jgi:hypothetical protein
MLFTNLPIHQFTFSPLPLLFAMHHKTIHRFTIFLFALRHLPSALFLRFAPYIFSCALLFVFYTSAFSLSPSAFLFTLCAVRF